MPEAAPKPLVRLPIHELLGIEIVSAAADRVVGTMTVGRGHMNGEGTAQGGLITAFADCLAGRGAALNLAEGWRSTTIETKTNFFAPGRDGVIDGEATPIHLGRTTSVWQTRVRDGAGRDIALVLQTQIALPRDGAAPAAKPTEVVAAAAEPAVRNRAEAVARQRAKIFQAASAVIEAKGFDRANVREIAEAAGMPVATMYQYVRNKEDILLLIFDTYLPEVRAALAGAVEGPGTATERLEAGVAALMKSFERYRSEIKLMFQETKSLNAPARRRTTERVREMATLWQELMADGTRRGEFHVKHPEIVAHLIPMMCAVWPLRYWAVGAHGSEAVAKVISRVLLDGLAADKAPKRRRAAPKGERRP